MHDPQTVTPRATTTSFQVLLIEDNPGDARLFEEYLREGSSEINFRWEQELASGLGALIKQPPEVLVLDLGLPDSGGIDTVRRCTDAKPSVPVVVLTGDSNLDTALAAQEAGATEYLQKEELTPDLVERTLRWAQQRARMETEIRQHKARFQGLANSIPGIIFQFEVRSDGTYGFSFVSERAEEILGISSDPDDFLERALERTPPNYRQPLLDSIQEAAETETTWRHEGPFEKPSGEQIWLLATSSPVHQEDGLVFNGVLLDITERKRAEAQTGLQTDVFKQVLQGRPLRDVLSDLIERLEERRSDMLGSILLHDSEEGRIRHGAAPSLPDGYNQALDGLETGSDVGSCGTAMYTGEMVITEDIKADPRWEEYRNLALEHGLRACWSVPIQGPEGDVLGTFAMYYREPKQPSEKDRVLIDEARSLAELAIERHRENEELRLMSEAVEQANEAVLVTEAESLDDPGPRIVYVNEAFETMTGYAEEEVLGQTPRLLQGPETEREVLDSFRDALEAGEEWEGEAVNYRKNGRPYVVQWNVSPVTNEEGDIECWVSVQRDITEQRERKERLTQMARALEEVDDKVLVTDREGQVQYVNQAFEEITGYTEEEIIGQTPSVLRSGGHDEDFYEELWDTIRSGETFRAEFTNERKDGTTYVEDESISPIADEDGQITHFVSSGRDITERKQREMELRRQRNLLEQTQRLAGAWEVDLDSGALSWSDKIYEIHELPPGTEVDLEEAIEFYAPEARSTARETYRRCVEEGESFDQEFPLITAKGNRRWVRVVGAPVEEDGEAVKVAGAQQDITERKETEHKLRESEERFRGMFDSAAIGIAILDDDGRIVEANPALREMTGYTEGGLQDTHFEEVTHSDDLDPDVHRYGELVAGNLDRYQMEKRYLRKGGDVFWGRLTVSRYEGGQEGQVIGMVEDIDEQKRYEKNLREAKEEAERMNRLKSAFLANMSHEIRTPLTSIIGFAEAIGEQVDPAEEEGPVPRFARLIEKSGRRLMETLTGVLNLSRLEAGEMSLASEPVDLNVEVQDMIEHFQPRAEKKGVDLQGELGDAPVWVQGDTQGLRIILRNLISNALKYTEEGGRVQVRTDQTDAAALLEVEDTGIGMDPEQVPELFEAFAQASNGIGREYEGSGLGLAVTKQAVEGMDGSIKVETEKGVGSCFVVQLPRAEAGGEAGED